MNTKSNSDRGSSEDVEYEMETEQSPRGHKRRPEEEVAQDPSRPPTMVSSPSIPPKMMKTRPIRASTYRNRGAVWQEWIADPARAGCPVQRSEVTLADLIHNRGFTCRETRFSRPSEVLREDLKRLQLPVTEQYRYTELDLFGVDKEGYRGYSQYGHFVGPGVFIAEGLSRHTGPHWSDIVLAQYTYDHDVNTLRHLYYVDVTSEQTLPLVRDVLYPRHNLDWPVNYIDSAVCHTWEYGTREYQEILGTQLGKAAACVVLGAWDRGTHRIARIVTEVERERMNMRFDFEAIPTPGPAHGGEVTSGMF
ncbi:uncharacterized protein N7515_010280 [Penicillium bovifimosum]|uniref:Uncharacterized protein n=1 Tax=Penicillium bovifimosum TaxID=126998 RepID=A0A9W9KUY3_9EURO|nr:uncharacterized protein N7515_010280 [Penicillium bovifimosum]KAJ5120892.1 hypothetical protein N7515_010280 [Penicillium bovifimosum]